MDKSLSILKGLHPGLILERELNKRNLSRGRFAISIGEYPQTIGAIINGKRDMNTPLSIKIEQALKLEEGYFMILQVYHDIKKLKQLSHIGQQPDLSLIRPALFWDTDINKIDWQAQKRAIIKRVFERGNEAEKAEIKKFYGEQSVNQILKRLNKPLV